MLSARDLLSIQIKKKKKKQVENERMVNMFYTKGNQERAGVVILVSEKIDLKCKKVQETKKDTVH